MEKLLIVSAVFSMIGMGGGTLYVPILLFAGYTIKQAPAISLVLIIATSATAMTAYWRGGRVDWKLTAVVGPTMLAAAFAGGKISLSMNKDALKKSFGVLVLLIAARMIFRLVAG